MKRRSNSIEMTNTHHARGRPVTGCTTSGVMIRKFHCPMLTRSVVATLLLGLGLLTFGGCDDDHHSAETDNHGEHGDHAGHGHEEGHDDDEHDDHVDHGNEAVVVELTSQQMQSAGIETARISATDFLGSIKLPGTVALRDAAESRVGSSVSGRVAAIHVSEGRWVRKGAPLLDVESPEIAKARAEYLDAAAAERQAKLEYDRQERLAAEMIGAERAFEEARAVFEMAEAAKREAAAHLRTYGIDPSRADKNFSNRMRIVAPMTGIVAERNVALGEYVDGSDDLIHIVDISSVWIDAQATPEQVANLAIGTLGFVVAPNGTRKSGRISFIGPTVNQKSRTVTTRFTVENTDRSLRPGMFVTVEYRVGSGARRIVLPKGAVEEEGGEKFVWTAVDGKPQTFKRVPTVTGEELDGGVIVVAGLEEGDRVVVEGAFYLRSTAKAGELKEHSH